MKHSLNFADTSFVVCCFGFLRVESCQIWLCTLQYVNILSASEEKANFATSIDLDEGPHNELPHLALHCFLSGLGILNMIAWTKLFLKLCRH